MKRRRSKKENKKARSSFTHTKNSFSRQQVAACVHFAAMSAARKLSFTAVATTGEVKWTRDKHARAAALREGHN